MKNQIKKIKKQGINLNKQFINLKEKYYNDNKQYNLKKEKTIENQIDILDVAQYIVIHQNKKDYNIMKIQKLFFLFIVNI